MVATLPLLEEIGDKASLRIPLRPLGRLVRRLSHIIIIVDFVVEILSVFDVFWLVVGQVLYHGSMQIHAVLIQHLLFRSPGLLGKDLEFLAD